MVLCREAPAGEGSTDGFSIILVLAKCCKSLLQLIHMGVFHQLRIYSLIRTLSVNFIPVSIVTTYVPAGRFAMFKLAEFLLTE